MSQGWLRENGIAHSFYFNLSLLVKNFLFTNIFLQQMKLLSQELLRLFYGFSLLLNTMNTLITESGERIPPKPQGPDTLRVCRVGCPGVRPACAHLADHAALSTPHL